MYNAKDASDYTPLLRALSNEDVSIGFVESLLGHGADVAIRAMSDVPANDHFDVGGANAIVLAVLSGSRRVASTRSPPRR